MLARTFGSARVVYNDFLSERDLLRRAEEHKSVSFGDTAKKVITQAKRTPERAWLSEVSNIALQQSVRQAERAYRNWFESLSGVRKGKVGHPRFKKRSNRQSITLTRGGSPSGRPLTASGSCGSRRSETCASFSVAGSRANHRA